MNSDDLNNTNMINTTTKWYDDHAADTATITDYAGIVTEVKNKMVIINGLNIIAGGSTKGVTLDTKAIRNVMEDGTLTLCYGLTALGTATNNNEMIVASNFTKDKLSHLPKDEVDDKCEAIQILAAANAAALLPKGIAATDITDVDTAIILYRNSMSNPTNKKVEIKNANDKIHPIIRTIIDTLLIPQLDKLTLTLKTKKPDYVSGYFLSREKIDLGHGTTKIKGAVTVKDSSPVKPVYPATIKITNGTDTYEIHTDLNGVFSQQIKRGTYNGTCNADGFDTFIIEPFLVKQGTSVELLIQMTLAV